MLNWLKSIVVIFIIGFCYGQKPMVQLIVDPKVAEVGEEITITVKSNVFGKIDDLNLPAAFVPGNGIMTGVKPEMDYATGKMLTYYYYSQNGALGKEGTFTFGPVYIKKGRKIYKSNTVTVVIQKDKPVVTDEITPKQLKKPAFGIIEKSKTKIYEGEPVVLVSKVYSHFEPTHCEGYLSYELEGTAEKHELGGNQQLMTDRVNVKGLMMYYFELDKQVIFPTNTGRISVDPFKMNLKRGIDGYSLTSNGTYLEVMPLPSNPPKDFIGGVGEFSFTRSIDNTSFKQGDVMVMTVIVTGEGNLHNINTPKLKLPVGMIQYGDPIIEDDYSFGSRGAQGKITFKFNIQLMKDGIVSIPEMSISYFNVSKQQYVTLSEQGDEITVSRNSKFTVTSVPENVENPKNETLTLLPLKAFSPSNKSNSLVSSPLFLIALFSPVGLALLFVFLRRKKARNSILTEEIGKKKLLRQKAWKEYELAEQAFSKGASDDFYSAILRSLFMLCSSELRDNSSSTFSKQELFEELAGRDVSDQSITDLKNVFQSCEEARYGLGIEISSQVNILRLTKEVMLSLTDQLKNKK